MMPRGGSTSSSRNPKIRSRICLVQSLIWKEKDVARIGKEQGTAKGELDAVMKKMADISPNCEYFAVNYKLRFANRNVEIDGLNKAKTILEGGTFAKPVDPNREMKPGDAFLQRK